ncbi:MAG: hypothetical protein ACWA44_12605 [Thiotrichales bacterium]
MTSVKIRENPDEGFHKVRHLLTTLTILTAFGLPFVSYGQVLKLNSGTVLVQQQANMPARGMDKLMVEAKFGAPKKKHPAIGKPPISSWDYPGFTTYFEGNLVLHSVVHSAPPK